MFTGLFLYRKEAGVWECNFSVLNKPSLHSALVNVITEKGIIKPKKREIVCCKVQNLVLWQSNFFDDFKYIKLLSVIICTAKHFFVSMKTKKSISLLIVKESFVS